MKYIESEVLISAMILGMYENNQESISDDEAERFGMNYIAGLKKMYFPKEPLLSDHISHKSIVKFYDLHKDALSYSFLEKKLTIKYLPPEEEAFFRAMLTTIVASWAKKADAQN